ncbi:hypothetical protein [Acinetobacter soli]|uniref:hypothetical protein n=1 Tax=Acinetobacter soli TaxID=487316 RepID=UPI00125066CD|nr:hypothetical protein [Acinetobacter soli]
MNTILNAKEAFEALQNRKTVLCRYAGDGTLPGDKDFSSLDQMPATVFVMPHYEFCIKIETMELAGITFAKPLVPKDIHDHQEIYIVMPTCILRTKYDAEHTDVHNAVMNGFAQADADNALLQLKALGAVFGNAIDSVEVKDGFEEKPKRQRKQRETKINTDEQCDLLIEAINICDSDAEIKNVLENLDEYKFSQKQLNMIFNARAKRSSDFRNSTTEATTEQNSTGITITKQGPVSVVEDTLISESSSEQTSEDFESILADLIERASTAQSPAEANALFKYTKGWTQEQSAPLHAAVSRRLAELPQPEAKEPPSLLVRIQKAADLTELDALEIDVSARDERIQPTLMAEVYKRRKQLEAPIDLIDEAFP